MLGHVCINLALVLVAGCGEFQQMNEPTRRGDHANDRALSGRAAELGRDKRLAIRVAKTYKRIEGSPVKNMRAKSALARVHGLMADSDRNSAESSLLCSAKVSRLRLNVGMYSTDFGSNFHCARTTNPLRRMLARSRRLGGESEIARALTRQTSIIRAVGHDQITSSSFPERNREPRKKFFALLLVMSLVNT